MSQNYGWIEIVFSAAVALGFGFYQLWSVNREIRQDEARKAAKSTAADQPTDPAGSSPD